jgi:hypothetical protein
MTRDSHLLDPRDRPNIITLKKAVVRICATTVSHLCPGVRLYK